MVSVTDRLDRTFGALSDPTRRAILARLAEGEASVTELAEPFEMSVNYSPELLDGVAYFGKPSAAG